MLNRLYAHPFYKKHRNIILYGLIGGMGATLDFVLYAIFFKYIGITPFLASFLSVSLAIVNNFFLNHRHNFKTTGHLWTRLTSFYLTGISGALLSSLLIYIGYNLLSIDALIAKLATIIPVVLLQFFINKHVSFSDNPKLLLKRYATVAAKHWLTIMVVALSVFFFMSSIFFLPATDDLDNMLGGKLILDGSLPYKDFFSHHSPGMYFISAIIYLFSDNNPFIFRAIFNLIVFVILLTTWSCLRKRVGHLPANLYLLLAATGHIIAWGQLPLGESIIAQLIPLLIVLVLLGDSSTPRHKHLVITSILLFLVPFLSLAYILPCLAIYGVLGIRLLRTTLRDRAWSNALISISILFAPYIIFVSFLILSGSAKDMYYDLFTFNTTFYAPMVGEQGNGIISTTISSAINNLEQMSIVVRNPFSSSFYLQALLLLGFVTFSIYLWRTSKKIESIMMIVMLVLLSPRSNIFNAPAIQTTIDGLGQHAAAYIGAALLCTCIGFVLFAKTPLTSRLLTLVSRFLGAFALLIIFASVSWYWAETMHKIFISKQFESYYAYSNNLKRNNQAHLINELSSPESKAWIAPANFGDQLYLKPERSSRFTFYMPWLDKSPKIRSELIASLQSDQPTIIYFGSYTYKGEVYNYHADVTNFLNTYYFSVSDQRLSGYHFNINDKSRIIKELSRYGYKAN